MTKKIKNNLLFALSIFLLYWLYFFVYFYLLQIHVTLLHISFIIIFSLSFTALLNFISYSWWRIICYIILAMFLLSSLVNFAYFQVFDTFLIMTWHQVAQMDYDILNLFKDFRILIPIRLYILSTGILIATIFISFFYFKHHKKRRLAVVLFQNTKLFIHKSTKKYFIKRAIVAILVFIIINFGALVLVNYIQQNPKDTWWQPKQQISDLGFLGDFDYQIFTPFIKASGEELQNIEQIKNYDLPDGLLARSKYIYQNILPDFGQNKNHQDIVLPDIPAQPNILIIQLESVGNWAIDNDPSPMPFLQSLLANNTSVQNFYANSCQTINAEFTSLCSFWPSSLDTMNNLHIDNDYYCLPEMLQENFGYSTHFFHSDLPSFYDRGELLPKWSFENIYLTPYFRQKEDDEFVFTNAVQKLSEETKPFFAYVLSFTTHAPHNDELIDYNLEKNDLKITPWRDMLNPEYVAMLNNNNYQYETVENIENFYGFLKTTDDALRATFQELKNSGLIDNTIIFIYNDHRFYNFFPDNPKGFNDYNSMPFTMILPNKEKTTIQSIASHLDIAPTIWHLLNKDLNNMPEHFVGNSLYDPDFPNQALNKCLGDIFYVDENAIVRGSKKSGIYTLFHTFKEKTDNQKDKLIKWVKQLVNTSDATMHQNKITP